MPILQDAPVFLFACGRSGSTLVQRLLNTNDDVHMWGEHGGALVALKNSYRITTGANVRKLIDQTPVDCHEKVLCSEPVIDSNNWSVQWYNSFTDEDARNGYRGLVEKLFANSLKATAKHWGFKEIRYGLAEAEFLRELFPEAKFLVLVRNPKVVVRSQLEYFYLHSFKSDGQFDETKLKAHVDQALKSISRVADLTTSPISDNCLLVRYEEILADPLSGLFEVSSFLGISEFEEDKINVILSETKETSSEKKDAAAISVWIDEQIAEGTEAGISIRELCESLSYET